MASISEWRDPPQMDTGAPMPGICSYGSELLLAYIVSSNQSSTFEDFAIVKFSGVLQHIFGYPNDEALGGHSLYKLGLALYAFNVVQDSPYIDELCRRNASVIPNQTSMYRAFTHWFVAFHDESLEVVGRSAEVVGRVEAMTANRAIRWYLDSVTGIGA